MIRYLAPYRGYQIILHFKLLIFICLKESNLIFEAERVVFEKIKE